MNLVNSFCFPSIRSLEEGIFLGRSYDWLSQSIIESLGPITPSRAAADWPARRKSTATTG